MSYSFHAPRWRLGYCIIVPAIVCSAGQSGFAQAVPAPTAAVPGPAGGAIENVVVTAQKRSQKIQDIPITITVLDRKRLQRLDVRSSDELSGLVPALEIQEPSGKGNQPLINIRGIGLNDTNTNNAGPNGVYVDEVYEASPAGQTFQTFDLSRVEVLKGPQGTLYGRNTTGGAINYITAKPTDDFSASEDIQFGSFNTVSTESMINGQIAPRVDARAAIQYTYSDGYFSDLLTGKKTNGANDLAYRGQVKIEATDDLTLLLNLHGGNVHRRPDEYRSVGVLNGLFGAPCSNSQVIAGGCTDLYGYKGPSSFYKGYYNRSQELYINAVGGSVRADWRLGDVTLTSLTALEISHKLHPEDTDADPYDLIQIDYGVRSTDITQEFRVAGGGLKYHWLAGLYGLSEHLQQDQSIDLLHDLDQVVGVPGAGNGLAEQARTLNGQFTESAALFGQGDIEVFRNARLTLGGRLTYEHKTFDAFSQAAFETNGVFPLPSTLYNVNENLADRAASWRAAFDYKFAPTILGYASVSTGFKSGGFNGGFLANDVSDALAQLRPIRPEYILAYEVGAKSDLLDRRLRVNAAGFYYSYRDLQVFNLIAAPSAVGAQLPLSVLTNAPTAIIKGAEIEVDTVPLRNLDASVSVSYVDATLGPFVSAAGAGPVQDLTGKQLPNAPRFNVVLQAGYRLPLPGGQSLDLSGIGTYRSHQFFESNNNPLVAQGAYWLLNARLAYDSADKHWEAAVVGKNLTGQRYLNFANDLTTGLGLIEQIVGAPRYIGGELVYRY